jgi:hypothetical protein
MRVIFSSLFLLFGTINKQIRILEDKIAKENLKQRIDRSKVGYYC